MLQFPDVFDETTHKFVYSFVTQFETPRLFNGM